MSGGLVGGELRGPFSLYLYLPICTTVGAALHVLSVSLAHLGWYLYINQTKVLSLENFGLELKSEYGFLLDIFYCLLE